MAIMHLCSRLTIPNILAAYEGMPEDFKSVLYNNWSVVQSAYMYFCQAFYDSSSAKLPFLDKISETGVSTNLEIMLDPAVTDCTFRNWIIYEVHGGLTFKIRFNSIDNAGQYLIE